MRRCSGTTRQVTLAITVAVFAVFAAALVLAVSGCARVPSGGNVATGHPAIAPGQECTSCKAPLHSFVHQPPYQGDCRLCHVTSSWLRVTYSHPLVAFNQGLHAVIGCGRCHTATRPIPPASCSACHATKHVVVANCEACHTGLSWRILNPRPAGHVSLAGGHKKLTCFSCHSGVGAFSHPNGCESCHGSHHGLTHCETCHDPSLGWTPKGNFDHSQFFALTGVHKTLACARCHPNNQFAAADPRCGSCHAAKHGGLTNCSACHTTVSFQFSTFQHSSVFALTGRHATVACSKCHPQNKYATAIGTPGSCVSCHGARHGGLVKCASCHTTAGFVPSTFRHSRVYVLTGAHRFLACSQCHPRNLYAKVIGSPRACVNCHGVMHGNQTRCDKCHTTAAFSPAKRIAHPGFPALAGPHATLPCQLCHPTLIFNARTRRCSACHSAPHVAPTDCLRCHRPTRWSEVHFTHPAVGYHTQLPIDQACLYCHTEGNYAEYRCDRCHFAIPYNPADF